MFIQKMMVNYIIGYLCFFFENEDAGKLYKPLVFGLLTLQTNPSTELRFVGSWFVDLFTWYIPDAPCMVYLPTFGWFLGHMLVNIPYMEHLGILMSSLSCWFWLLGHQRKRTVKTARGLYYPPLQALHWTDILVVCWGFGSSSLKVWLVFFKPGITKSDI